LHTFKAYKKTNEIKDTFSHQVTSSGRSSNSGRSYMREKWNKLKISPKLKIEESNPFQNKSESKGNLASL